MPSCSVRGCGNYHGKPNCEKVSYYRFPKDEKYCLEWYRACAKNNLSLKSATICSKHFEPTSLATCLKQKLMNYLPKGGSRLLKPDALPTVNLPESNENFPDLDISKQELENILTWCSLKNGQKRSVSQTQISQNDLSSTKINFPKKRHKVVNEILALIPQDTQLDGDTKKIIILRQSPASTLRDSPQPKLSIPAQNINLNDKQVLTVPYMKTGGTVESTSTEEVNCLFQLSDDSQQINTIETQLPGNLYIINNSISPDSTVKSTTNTSAQNNAKLSVSQIISKQPLILPKTMKGKSNSYSMKQTSSKLPILTRQNALSVQNDSFISHSSAEKSVDDCDTSGMVMLKEEFKEMKRTIDLLKDDIKSWQLRYNNLKEEKETLENKYNNSLSNRKRMVDGAVHSILSSIFTPGQIKLLLSTGKSRINWTVKDMRMALALRTISPRAYKYLRNHLKYPLPAPSSVRRFKLLYPSKSSEKSNQTVIEESNQEQDGQLVNMLSSPIISLSVEEPTVINIKAANEDL